MLKLITLMLLIVLSACTVNVIDKRLTREEVAQALAQRDQVIKTIIERLESKSPEIKVPKK